MKTYTNKSNARRAAKRLATLHNFVVNFSAELLTGSTDKFVPSIVVNIEEDDIPADLWGLALVAPEVEGAWDEIEEKDKEVGHRLTIEKNREERNGIKKPSLGGKCRAVWDYCDMYFGNKGTPPMPKHMKETAEEKGWNKNNAVLEMYQWRRFIGIAGRK